MFHTPMNNVICPHCKKSFELSEAFKHDIEEKILESAEEKYKKELEKIKLESEEKAQKRAERELESKLKTISEDAKETEKRNEKLIDDLLKATNESKLLKQKDRERELEMQKKLAFEEEKIRLDAQKKAEEEQHLKILEKDKQLKDALLANEDMRRKLQQGSQQTQGEAFEQEFENILKVEFPNDKIEEVAKGTKGGDIIQQVWDRNGNMCGTILWELKNTKAWSEQWVDKIKGDQREIMADYAVIISEVVPNEIQSAKYYKNVWITKKSFVVGLASALRINLIQIAMAKRAGEGKKEKMGILYSYVSGTEFRLRVEAIIEAFSNMQIEIEKEKRYFSNKWARDEKNIRQVIDNTYGMHGDLKGIIGVVMQQIKGLEDSLELEDGNK